MANERDLAQTISDDDVAVSTAPAARDDGALGRGAALGRYVILERLGEGGMGVVYAAYDPELDRRLAVKLLHDDRSGAALRRARLLREAQTLARLDHPNVVAVHDVGVIDDQVFVAMELVAGQTVTAWLAEQPRDWRTIVEVFRQAGLGLAAAHAMGIVHRDFKPDNVLIDGDHGHGHSPGHAPDTGRRGHAPAIRVRVVDFGLARTAEDADDAGDGAGAGAGTAGTAGAAGADDASAAAGSHGAAPGPDRGRLARPPALTRTGAVVGTPGYIAPEQHLGKTPLAIDQFSFCVALWKALYGELPFAGESPAVLAAAAASGAIRPPPRHARVPAWLHRVVARGLAADPAARFASMDDLLAALARHPARTRRRVAAVLAVAAVAVTALVLRAAASSDRPLCRGGETQLAGAWGPARRAALAQAFAATGVPYAATAVIGVAGALDRYAGAWSAMRTEACEATRVRGEQSEELLDLRMACLDLRARELRALGDVLVHADARVVEKSLQAALALSPVEACADAGGLRAQVPPPARAADRSRIDELRGELAEARALDSAGRFADAIARAAQLAGAARATGYRPLEAAALTVLGTAQRDAGKLEDAQASLEAAVVAAIAGRDDATGAEAATVLVRLVGYDRARHDDGEPWVARAEAFLEAHPDDRLRAQLENNIGTLRFGEDRFDESLEHHRASLALRERIYGPASPLVAASLDNIGLGHDYKGDNIKGTEFHRRALAIDLDALGPMHPTVALTLTNLAVSLRQQGALGEALTTAQRALAIKEVAYGPDSAMVAMSLNEIGNNYYFQGRHAEAAEVFRRSLAIKQHTLGPDHPAVAGALVNLANCLERMHQLDEAEALVRQALAIKLKALGPDHSDLGHSYTQLGQLALDRRRFAEARAQFAHAAAIWTKAMGPDNPLVASADNGVGDAELGAGHVAEAIAAYTAAAAIRDARPVDLADRATSRFGLARAVWAAGDHARARSLAADAIQVFRDAGSRADADRREAEAWLAAQR